MAVSKVLTDIHCHILPGIDDGAKDADASGALLLSEKQQGISQIIFTPHYYADEISVEGYIKGSSGQDAEFSGPYGAENGSGS